MANEAADRNIDLKQLFDILTAHHAGKVFAANETVICRHRGGKRIGLMLKTSDKNVHEKLPVLRLRFADTGNRCCAAFHQQQL
jgi:hypothetical protein